MFEGKIKNIVLRVFLGGILCFAAAAQTGGAETVELISSGYVSQLAKVKRKIRPFNNVDVSGIIERARENNLEAGDIETILQAKRCWAKLLSRQGRFIGLEPLAEDPVFKGLDKLRLLAAVQCRQCDERLHEFLERIHREKRQAIDAEKRKAVVQGAGPCGLLAGIKLYLEGMRVSVLEKRSGSYTRRQIVSLDPAWVAGLRLILGMELGWLIRSGHAELLPDQSLQIAICELEKALKKCIQDLAAYLEKKSYEEAIALHYNTELIEVLPPEGGGGSWRLPKTGLIIPWRNIPSI